MVDFRNFYNIYKYKSKIYLKNKKKLYLYISLFNNKYYNLFPLFRKKMKCSCILFFPSS